MMNKRVALLFALVLLLAIVSCQSMNQLEMDQQPDTPSMVDSNKEIVIYGLDGQIWQMNADGTQGQIIITNNTIRFATPRVSPDASRILFFGRENDKSSIWVADIQGQNSKQVSPEFDLVNVHWVNPEILFTSIITDVGLDVNPEEYFVLDLNENSLRPYPDKLEGGFGKRLPSGDGWISWWNGFLTLYKLDGEVRTLFPDWVVSDSKGYEISPSGQEIIFQGIPPQPISEKNNRQVFLGSISGNQQPKQILELECCGSFYWSPDEDKIAIFSPNDDSVMIIAGQTYETLNKFDVALDIQGKYGWSPSSKDFLILADYSEDKSDRNFELAKINLETGEITRLTFNENKESGAAWAVTK